MGAGQAPVSDAIQGPVGDGGLGTVDTRGQTGMTSGGVRMTNAENSNATNAYAERYRHSKARELSTPR